LIYPTDIEKSVRRKARKTRELKFAKSRFLLHSPLTSKTLQVLATFQHHYNEGTNIIASLKKQPTYDTDDTDNTNHHLITVYLQE